MNATKGAFVLVLHAHLPYVLSHGRWPHGTDWLNEATAETYVPLLSMLNGLVQAGRSSHITIGVTPVLAEQLADPSFPEEFRSYIDHRIEAAQTDAKEFDRDGARSFADTARHWERFFTTVRRDFVDTFEEDLIGAFKTLQDSGHIEVITSAATHAYLPLVGRDANVRTQIRVGVESYRRHYGRPPAGVWLPECAYRPRYPWKPPTGDDSHAPAVERAGIEEILTEHDLRYFFVDSALLRGGEPMGAYLARFGMLNQLWQQFSEHRHIREEDFSRDPKQLHYAFPGTPTEHPVAIFTRDVATGHQVWSGHMGYPGDPNYLEFHKKRSPGGLRYWRVTDSHVDLGDKQQYEPDRVDDRLRENADHFCGLVRGILLEHYEATGRPGVLCSPYDAELFGHWWFEGVRWLREVLIRLSDDPDITVSTCSEALQAHPPQDAVKLPEGSWGEGGYHYIWLNQDTEWTWTLIYEAEARMQRLLALARGHADKTLTRIVTQAGRELLLLESSDWQFVISTAHARDYAHLRINNHYEAFSRLAELAEGFGNGAPPDDVAMSFLEECEMRDGLFPYLDLAWFDREPAAP